MENNRFAVGAQLDVAFDGEAAGDRRLGRPKRIFDHALALRRAGRDGRSDARRARKGR